MYVRTYYIISVVAARLHSLKVKTGARGSRSDIRPDDIRSTTTMMIDFFLYYYIYQATRDLYGRRKIKVKKKKKIKKQYGTTFYSRCFFFLSLVERINRSVIEKLDRLPIMMCIYIYALQLRYNRVIKFKSCTVYLIIMYMKYIIRLARGQIPKALRFLVRTTVTIYNIIISA